MNTKRLHKVFLLAVIFLLFFSLQYTNREASAIIGTPRYVAATGADTSDCSNLSAPCLTLAYAVAQSATADVINIAGGVYPVNVTISKSLTIQGAGMNATLLEGGGIAEVLDLTAGPVTINDLTIKNGDSKDYAGGIKSSGVNLTLTRVKITGNSGHFGGGVYFKDGTLNMTDCLVSDNSSTGSGGGINLSGSGSSTITGTTVTGNEGLEAGALSVINTGGVTVTNSTITANSCTRTTSCAGAINFNNQPGIIINSTITGNLSINDAALLTNGGTVTFKNSIIAFNYRGTNFDDCRAPNVPFVSNGYNLKSDTDCGGTVATDIFQTSPALALLGPLQDNGGLTPTVALLVGSPAIDAGTNTLCPATDQRGETRPYNGTCDIGAFEYQPLAGAFGKDQPADGATGLAADVTITWLTSPGADEYQWCVDQTDDDACDSSWITKATSLFEILQGMAPGEYFWTVRAKNGGGYTYSDGGVWWSFNVVFPPGTFNKTAPANGATNRPRNLTLRWNPSSNAVEYKYCLRKTGETCTWKTTGPSTSVAVSNLVSAKWYWQVKAINANGTVNANGNTMWTFTVPPKPGAFGKTSPVTNAINKPTTVTLYWAKSSNAIKYEYCIKKSLSAACTWKPTGLTQKVTLSGLLKNQKYYWQVRAKNAVGTTIANGGTWWNFTTNK